MTSRAVFAVLLVVLVPAFLLPAAAQSTKECKDCLAGAQYVKDHWDDGVYFDQVRTHVLGLCDVAPTYAASCKKHAEDMLLPLMAAFVKYRDAQAMCQEAEMCPSDAAAVASDAQAPVSCTECLAFVKQMQGNLADKSKLDLVMGHLGALCDLSPPLAATCHARVNQRVPEAIKTLLAMTPQDVCEGVGACDPSSVLLDALSV